MYELTILLQKKTHKANNNRIKTQTQLKINLFLTFQLIKIKSFYRKTEIHKAKSPKKENLRRTKEDLRRKCEPRTKKHITGLKDL